MDRFLKIRAWKHITIPPVLRVCFYISSIDTVVDENEEMAFLEGK